MVVDGLALSFVSRLRDRMLTTVLGGEEAAGWQHGSPRSTQMKICRRFLSRRFIRGTSQRYIFYNTMQCNNATMQQCDNATMQ